MYKVVQFKLHGCVWMQGSSVTAATTAYLRAASVKRSCICGGTTQVETNLEHLKCHYFTLVQAGRHLRCLASPSAKNAQAACVLGLPPFRAGSGFRARLREFSRRPTAQSTINGGTKRNVHMGRQAQLNPTNGTTAVLGFRGVTSRDCCHRTGRFQLMAVLFPQKIGIRERGSNL
jgi:hypothetical protein